MRADRPETVSLKDMPLDLPNGMLGEILVDFPNDARFHIGVKRMPQVCERARRRHDDQCRRAAFAHQTLQRGGHSLSKAMLLDFMPIRRLHGAAADRMGARERATGTIGPLLVRRRVLFGENALGHQIGKHLIAGVAQEKRLAAVADENESVMRNSELVHAGLLTNDARRRGGAARTRFSTERRGISLHSFYHGEKGPVSGNSCSNRGARVTFPRLAARVRLLPSPASETDAWEKKMPIEATEFGAIRIDGKTYNHDVIIRLSGKVEKRRKRLSKEEYGTSHILSKEEAKFVFENGAELLIVGAGQQGNVRLSPEASEYFDKKHCRVLVRPTPEAVRAFNQAREKKIALMHVTC